MLSHLWSLIVLLPVLAASAPAYQDEDEEPEEPTEEPICDSALECPQFCALCPLDYQPKPFPKRTVPKVYIGWANGSSYHDNGLFGPMLIPVEIASQDPDEVHIKCAGGCQKMDWQGDWTIDWKVTGHNPAHPYPFRQGSFVNAQATRLGEIKDRWAVLYLPPEDLAPGETRPVAFQAKIRDLCPEGVDQESTVDFSGTVKRIAGGMWEVSLNHAQPNIPNETQEPCQGAPALCELVGPSVLPDTFPEERFRDLPARMYVDEVRALTLAAKDCDRLFAECGIPSMFCSTFCRKRICDEISYVWWVSHVNPLDTGQGVVEQFGTLSPSTSHMPRSQTVMFTATKKGKLRLNIQANSKSGDATVFIHDMEIFERKLKLVDHKPEGQHEIFVDGDMALSYSNLGTGGIPGIEWEDTNNNGVATDVNDLNFPMAYTKGGQPKLNFFVQLALDTTAMPGAIIYGIDNALNPAPATFQYVGRLDHGIHIALPNGITGFDFQTLGVLPDVVGRHAHTVKWEVTYIPTRPVSHAVSHTYRVYTTLTTPVATAPGVLNPAKYRHWESAYDISCKAAQGATTPTGAATGVHDKLTAHFNGRHVFRKDKNGINQDDDVELIYWGDVGTALYTATCEPLAALLQAASGLGRCGSISRLYKLCLAIHGEQAEVTAFVANMAPRRRNPALPVPATMIVPPPLDFIVPFLVKDWGLPGHVGDLGQKTYFTSPGNVLTPFAPVSNFTDVDGDRGRTFYNVDSVPPHTAAWSRAVDNPGVVALGCDNPRAWFTEHALVRYPVGAAAFYDPSYGTLLPYANEDAYAAAALDAVGVWDLWPNNPGAPAWGNPDASFSVFASAGWVGGADAPDYRFIGLPDE